MSFIEGVGDEVTQFFILTIVILIGIIAWWSTGIADQPLIRTVLILERRTRHRIASEPPSNPPTVRTTVEGRINSVQPDIVTPPEENQQEVENNAECHTCDKESSDVSSPPTSSSSSDLNTTENWELPETSNGEAFSGRSNDSFHSCSTRNQHLPMTDENETNIPQTASDADSNLLRSRRLAFFQSRQVTLLESPETVISAASSTDGEGTEATSNIRQATETCHISSESSNEIPSEGSIRIRLKYLNDDQKLVEGKLQEQLGDFKRRHFNLEMSADKLVRLIFNGQVLQSDSETLEGYGLFDNCVVHCLVHQQRSGSSHQPGSTESQIPLGSANNTSNEADAAHREWDLGNVLFASLSLLLGLAWYCRYQYAQLFNATTTVALVGLTGILTVSLVGVYLPDQDGIRQQ